MKDPKKILIYIKYPYTALIITVIWICIIAILVKTKGQDLELILMLTSLVTIYLAYIGFKPIK